DFQDVLSSLNSVWINTATCGTWDQCFSESWGWWRRVARHPVRHRTPLFRHERIVGLSASLWSTTYSGYETVLTQGILSQSGIFYSQIQPVDDLATALLAALAHEVGHIRWFEWGVNSDPVNFCNPATFCATTIGNFFGGWSASTVF